MTERTPVGFVSLKSLKRETLTPDETVAEIRRIYFKTTRQTIQHDLAHAIELLKTLPDEESRQSAAVYMNGLSQMRTEWTAYTREGYSSKNKGQRSKVKRPK
jgi:hypothetical protein